MSKILFRADASIDIGTGHVMRCLTLANTLHGQGAECTFVCRAHQGHLGERIQAAGHALHLLPAIAEKDRPDATTDLYANWLGCTQQLDAQQTVAALDEKFDWLVVDHYGLDRTWETELRACTGRILAIDDLANRPHDCALLLDQNLGRAQEDYDGLVPDKAKRLIGPRYALLRPEFAELRDYSLQRRKVPRLTRILVSMGGVDKDNVTGQVLDSLARCNLPDDCHITVVMGSQAPWLADVQQRAVAIASVCEVRTDTNDMAQIMADSDLCIGAAGSTSWERCAMGLPSCVLSLAANQNPILNELVETGAALAIPPGSPLDISSCIVQAISDPGLLCRISDSASHACDALGRTRVSNNMQLADVRIRPMSIDDIEQVLEWRNHPDIRSWMHDSNEIPLLKHIEWFTRSQDTVGHWVLIVEISDQPLGFVQLRVVSGKEGIANWGFYKAPNAPHKCGGKIGLAALDYAFNTLGLHTIQGQAFETNDRSIMFHKALGFVDHGIEDVQPSEGEPKQLMRHFSLSAEQWPGW